MRIFSNKNHGNRRSDEADCTPRIAPLSSSRERAKKKKKHSALQKGGYHTFCLMFPTFPGTPDVAGVFL